MRQARIWRRQPNAFLDLSQSTTFKIGPPDINARFIAPFVANKADINEWLAGGNSLWVQSTGFAIRTPAAWKKAYTLPSGGPVYTALAMNGNKAIGAWCGSCNNNGFARGTRRRHEERHDMDVHAGFALVGRGRAELHPAPLHRRRGGQRQRHALRCCQRLLPSLHRGRGCRNIVVSEFCMPRC